MNQCTAKSKRTGERCLRPPIKGRTTCYHHGGMSPRGIASATLKDGRYSKHLPTNLLATYQATKNDPNLLALIDEIAGVDAFSVDLLNQLHSGVSWDAAYDALMAFKDANLRKDSKAAMAAMTTLDTVITNGHDNDDTRDKIVDLWDSRRRLVESERKRRIEMHTMVTADQVALMVRSLTSIVRDHVSDPDALRAIADALGAIAVAQPD